MFYGTWWSLVPPVIAILLALITKEVYLSLFAGVLLGSLMITGFQPWNAFVTLFTTMADSMDLNIIIFDVLLGMIIVLMSRCGGTAAYGRWASGRLKNKKQAELATAGLGVLIFVDACLYHRPDFLLGGGSQFLSAGGRRNERLPALYGDHTL